jgi:hypothetical protein
MATSPTFTLVNVFVPNLLKLKGHATMVSAIERQEKPFLAPLWSQAFVTHDPKLLAQQRAEYRIGVFDLPLPKDLGDAYFVGIVVKHNDPQSGRYFTLEYDHVLAQRQDRTLVCERDGKKHTKHFPGPAHTGKFDVDAPAFIDAFMELLIPTRVARK